MICSSVPETAEISGGSPPSTVSSLDNKHKNGTKNMAGTSADEDGIIKSSLKRDIINPQSPEETKEKNGYTRDQWFAFVTLAIGNVCDGAIFSIQAPFYPPLAEAKGANSTEYGLVLGIFQLVVFIASPICGIMLGKSVPPKLMFYGGVLGVSLCTIAFGLLQYVHGHVMFVSLSFALRILQGCGQAACLTATFTIIATEFSESVATTFGTLETCAGFGIVIGPLLGGALYEAGGFYLPFVTIGGIYLLVGAASIVSLQRLKVEPERGNDDAKGFFMLLRIPEVGLSGLSIFLAGNSIGFLAATLEPHLRDNFQLSPLITGVIFAIEGVMYALAGPVWGWIADRGVRPGWTLLAGCAFIFIAVLLIGPAPFIPMNTILWVVCVGQAIQGIGLAAAMVGGVVQSLQSAIKNGFPDNVTTYGLLSALWSSSFALGLFIGPSVGGALLDSYAFANATYYILGCQTVLAALLATPASARYIRWHGRKNISV